MAWTYYCPHCGKLYSTNANRKNKITCTEYKKKYSRPPKIAYRENFNTFQHIIKNKKIRCLYHFTDQDNLRSIIRGGGLYSWEYCENNNIKIMKPGGNEFSRNLDVKYQLEDYVRLAFNTNTPMLYIAQRDGRIANPYILEISTDVILWNETKFSDINATANVAEIGYTYKDFLKIDFKIAMSDGFKNEAEKSKIQAEVLVKTHIPKSFILKHYPISNEKDLAF